MEYLYLSSWSRKPQKSPNHHRLLPLPLVIHHSYMVRQKNQFQIHKETSSLLASFPSVGRCYACCYRRKVYQQSCPALDSVSYNIDKLFICVPWHNSGMTVVGYGVPTHLLDLRQAPEEGISYLLLWSCLSLPGLVFCSQNSFYLQSTTSFPLCVFSKAVPFLVS